MPDVLAIRSLINLMDKACGSCSFVTLECIVTVQSNLMQHRYHESMLDCCAPLDVVKVKGITFKQFLCLAKCTGLDVKSYPADKTSVDHFRELVRSVTTVEDKVAVICYSRKTLQQTGDGHFAPIGGYHIHKDLVLVMDVARFKYPPHWAPLTTIWQAMNTPDAETG